MAGWSELTRAELCVLLDSRGQPTEGEKPALVARLDAFMIMKADDVGGESERGGGPSAAEAAELEVAGAGVELGAWRSAVGRLCELRAAQAQASQALARARAECEQQKDACAQQRAAAFDAVHARRARHNEQSCTLLQLVGHDDLRPTFMRAEVWGVLGLWRLRGVCRAFRRWALQQLSSLPRVVAIGGDTSYTSGEEMGTASVEMLDLSTMRWLSGGAVPDLPAPRHALATCSFPDGRVVVAGGIGNSDSEDEDEDEHQDDFKECTLRPTALQWEPGSLGWSSLPRLAQAQAGAAAVALPDGRAMLIAGYDNTQPAASTRGYLATVQAMTADGTAWSVLTPIGTPRTGATSTVLPCGKVLAAGGFNDGGGDGGEYFDMAELWDPATGAWDSLPPMTHARSGASSCVLPSGRVAVVGGDDHGRERDDGEAFDLQTRTWNPLPPMGSARTDAGLVAVAGGMVVVGGERTFGTELPAPELFDEASGQWFKLPQLVQPRKDAGVVSLPATAATAAQQPTQLQ
jgi:hypothetical protein